MSVHLEYDLGKFINGKLYNYQKNHTNRLINIIKQNNAVLDASDTGTGKTYTAIAACKFLKLKPIIICAKAIINNWKEVGKLFNVQITFVVNYETIKMGNYYSNTGNRIKCPYINLVEEEGNTYYDWVVEKDNIFIFDEVHKCAERRTQNSELLFSAKISKIPVMILSATIADRPERFMLFFFILNFIDPVQTEEDQISFKRYMHIMEKWILRDKKPMVRIHHMLYPERASRIRIDDLGDEFPETQIIAQSYYMGKDRSAAIEKAYKDIAFELDELHSKEKKDKGNPLVKIMRAHQKIELLKVATFVELARDFLENKFSVVIFVNFTQTLETLLKMLKTTCAIYGGQTDKNRQENIKNFMKNKERIIVCNIKAGGVGVSLHDIHGNHPRASLISPTWNSLDLVQSLGRIHRAGGKTKSLQRIIYAGKTIEENIARKIKGKLKNLSSVNNGDLDLTNIDFRDVY